MAKYFNDVVLEIAKEAFLNEANYKPMDKSSLKRANELVSEKELKAFDDIIQNFNSDLRDEGFSGAEIISFIVASALNTFKK